MNKFDFSLLRQSSSIIGYLIVLEEKRRANSTHTKRWRYSLTNMYIYNEHPCMFSLLIQSVCFTGVSSSFFTSKQTNRSTGAYCAIQLSDEWWIAYIDRIRRRNEWINESIDSTNFEQLHDWSFMTKNKTKSIESIHCMASSSFLVTNLSS